MTLRHFEVFIAVYDGGGMSAAARALNVAQPAISQTIKELENGYGVLLFERLSKRLRPTAAADLLARRARHLIGQYREMERGLLASRERPLLRVGASATVGTYFLPGIVASFAIKRPDVRVVATIGNTAAIEALILRDELDVGIVEGEVSAPGLSTLTIAEDELVIVCGPGDPLAGRRSVGPRELRGRAFAVRERGSGTRDLFESAMAREGVPWDEAWTSADSESILGAAAAGIALAAVPRRAAELRRGSVVAMEAPFLRLRRSFRIVSHKDKFESEALFAFRRACWP